MSWTDAIPRFLRGLVLKDEAGTDRGGLFALPTENPNSGSAADAPFLSAPLGALGQTPAGAVWRKTTSEDWEPVFPATGGTFACPVITTFQVDTAGTGSGTLAPKTRTAPFDGFIGLAWTLTTDDANAQMNLATAGGTAISLDVGTGATANLLLVDGSGAVGVGENGTPVTFANAGFSIGETLTLNLGGALTAESPLVYALLVPNVSAS